MRTLLGRRDDDRGLVAVEAAAALPLVLFVGVLTLQVGLIFAGVAGANGAARAAARADSRDVSARAAAEASLPTWLERELRVEPNGDGRVTVTLTVPSILPVIQPFEIRRVTDFPKER